MNANRRPVILLILVALSTLTSLVGGQTGAPGQLSGLDRTVAPGDDFFRFANGGWIQTTEIPADRSSWGVGGAVSELTSRRVADLIAETAKSPSPAGSLSRKIGDFYATFMDEESIEAAGLRPLQPTLDRIAAITDTATLARALGETLRADVDPLNATNFYTDNLFGLWVAQDLNDPSRYVPFLLQGGLGMPDRDYYLDPSENMSETRSKYRRHIVTMLGLAGVRDAEAKAGRILDLERRIAETHATREDSGEVQKGNNHWKREEFAVRAPGLDWSVFLEAASLNKASEFVVWHPGAAIGMSKLVAETPLSTWKEYLTFHAIEHARAVLPKAFVEEAFEFYGKELSGTPKLRDRWKRAVSATNGALGEAVGQLYVERYFPASEKARAEEMVKNELSAFSRRIDKLDWMSPQTKTRAKAKLGALKVFVGYPDKWRDYSGLEVVRGDALGNQQRSELFEYRHSLGKLGQPVDRGEWVMNPQLVNAVNLPVMNAMNFPAAILQPPFFDPSRPEAMDYGAIGAIIGHEISHSFDDQGALFDETGRLENWWTKEDFAHFTESAQRLVSQYNGYRPFPDLALNGKLTVGENIADLAGLAVAYDAYRLSLNAKEPSEVEGLTGDQQFFVSFAQAWRTKTREAALRQQVILDSHAPGPYRAATVRNLDPWYAAFGAKPGQALYLPPAERVRVW